ncbi:putative ribose-5-phosphate isomerase-like isoform X1 [Hibiscus syriacus]|uniref:Ribose-5-phosphate isomerase-like isoform X1 n=1 Tax=Hibiscus syriacus TaxID=106335 RepID=A0A6A3CDQ1_HIBSY|nr:putative ribose-5-phosphate isomerase-like isoform X1 [Hibiscus syriacus]
MEDSGSDAITAVYIVILKQAPAAHRFEEQLRRWGHHRFHNDSSSGRLNRFHKPRRALRGEKYLKLYSYQYLVNGFAVFITPEQANKLSKRREVANIVLDFSVRTATTHTPQFLGLPKGAWTQGGGFETAGEGIVIGFIDTGIDPTHPSFADDVSEHSYPVPAHFSSVCEVTREFPSGSCNRKLVGARHFAASAITRGIFNSSEDYASPFDGDGHGTQPSFHILYEQGAYFYHNSVGAKLSAITSGYLLMHTASVAAGNYGIPVVVAGHHFGNASGMAPRSHIAVYKALYKSFGGFAADVVAGIDQAAQDGVDIISLSITPNRRPPGIATFFNPIDMALLSAVKAGIFVVQAAGNTGPSPKSMSSFSPWIFTVGAASHDRAYSNSIILGNNVTIPGVGLAPGTDTDKMYTLISAVHALNNDTILAKDMHVGECQDSSYFNEELIQGNLLICSYSIRFVLGLSTIKQALETAKNLGAAGVVFYMDPFVIGFQLNPTPLETPGIIIPSPEDSKILLQYYNSSLERNGLTRKISRFGAVAIISGGLKANYSITAPKVMYYSARGPDPEDSFLDDADIMKPNLIAPGNMIWAAWSSLGMDSVEFQGESFAMMSGTSMAAPHIAGLAALIKQKFPHFSPAAIASALSTTASLYDNSGGPIMSHRTYANPDVNQSPATPFDMGSGFVNATSALNPGLTLDLTYDDYMSFLCGINGSGPVVLNYTGQNCWAYNSNVGSADLNLPSITVARLNQSKTVERTVSNIAGNETYRIGWSAPYGVSVKVTPTQFFIGMGEKQVLTILFNATMNHSVASFGRIGLFGDQGHKLNIPLSVIVKFSYNTTNS